MAREKFGMRGGFGLGVTLWALMAATACGASDTTAGDPEDSAEVKRKQITRAETEESSFKPAELEATIEELVTEIEETPAESMQLKIVLKTLTGYWEPVQLGASRALGELKVTGGVDAPLEDGGEAAIARQNEIMRDDRENGYDGFAVAPFEKPVAEQIDAAVDEGLPVVTIDSDLAESKRQLYIGTLNAEAGKTGGESLVKLLPEGGGTVVIFGHDEPAWPDGYDRTMGAKGVIEAAGYTVVVRKVDWTEEGEALDVAFLEEALETADPPAVGMLGVFSVAFRCAMAAENVGKAPGELAIAAFDFDAKTVEYMQSGYIQVTHAQRQYYMGYMAPYVLYGINVLGLEKTKSILGDHLDGARFNAGLDVVSAGELEDYYSFLDSLGIGGI